MIAKILALCVLLMLSGRVHAQLVFGTGSVSNSNGLIATQCDLDNRSSGTNLSGASLVLTGVDQAIVTSSDLSLLDLTVTGGGIKSLSGNFEITQLLTLTSGIIQPQDKLLFRGSVQPQGHNDSFVRGWFYSLGTGQRSFPIGNENGYYPTVLEDVTDPGIEIGIEVIEDDANIQVQNQNGIAYDYLHNRYWHVISTTGQFPASRIGLSTNGVSNLNTPVILGAYSPSSDGFSLELSSSANALAYSNQFLLNGEAIYTLGFEPEIRLVIHNLITPDATVDNTLQIDNLELFDDNTVTLVDRWGGVVHTWKNFNNAGQTFDFTSLSAGNYVCIVEYVDGVKKRQVSQVITVLK